VVDAYPQGQAQDLRVGEVLENIHKILPPETDPLFGEGGASLLALAR
jgi:hypothetical protein